MVTPKDILDVSEPVEAIYQRCVDELLINIAKHFRTTGWERTRFWEIKKLSELGALTEESARIIAKNTGMLPEEIEKAFFEVANKACLDIDPQLKAAAEQGILQDPETTPSASPMIRDMVRAYTEQAIDSMNMTNTTMLESTRQAYVNSVENVVRDEQLHEASRILETQSLNVATGKETRVNAIRKAMDQLSNAGLTGFVDRAGRKWQPEAYASMVVRTTSHNAAIQAIKNRQQEYGGGDIFQISSHTGARPLCAPYQGLFFTWSDSGGTFVDGGGQSHQYRPITDSSYGQPAGIFGINCGHHPIPIIPGFSFPQEGPTQTPEENAKEYEESQIQRQYERNIRKAKRDEEIARATGDEEAIKAAAKKVRDEQAKMRAFIDETGRARRYDRERIAVGGQGAGQAAPKKPDTRKTDSSYQPKSDTLKRLRDYEANKMIDRHDFKITKPLSEEKIIEKLAGGDQTKGSCSSLAFAYAGAKGGADIRDFRGGQSCNFFSRNSNINSIVEYFGGVVEKHTNDYTAAHKLFKQIEDKKEYYFACAKHAAVVRKTDSGFEYLEMQSRYADNNKWKPLNDAVLKSRFGAQRSHTVSGWKVENSNQLISIDALKDQQEFMDILTYINTPEDQQKKGKSGDIK